MFRALYNHFCYISSKSSDQCTNCLEQSFVAYLKPTKNTNVHLENSDIIILKYDIISKIECFDGYVLVCYTSFENNTSTYEVIDFDNNKAHDLNECNVIGNTANNNAIIYV